MDPIKEALTFDDVTLAPKYSEIYANPVENTVDLPDYDVSFKLITSTIKIKVKL